MTTGRSSARSPTPSHPLRPGSPRGRELDTTFVVVVPADAIVRRLLELTWPTVALSERLDDYAPDGNGT
jgi:hypothetical protein